MKLELSNATIEWKLTDGNFSMCGTLYNGVGRKDHNIVSCGQCIEEIASHHLTNTLVQQMLTVWHEWHLNDLTAGSPAQEAWIEANWEGRYEYSVVCKDLKEAGLNPDPNYKHNGKPYSYGHAWLKRELPADVVATIQSWSDSAIL